MVESSTSYIQNQLERKPEIGLILGSGLSELADEITDQKVIEYSEIPDFPEPEVEGHAGELVIGRLEGRNVIALRGRTHYYETGEMEKVVLPARVLCQLGIETLLITNAAGGVNTNFRPGDLMIINDHINNMGTNPLIGDNYKPRFPDMSEPYSKQLVKLAREIAEENSISVQEGVYMANTGPSYETPAEIEFADTVGADAVGMSTVPEVIVANQEDVDVVGVSCITNMAAGRAEDKLSHDEVIETAEKVRPDFKKLVRGIIEKC